MDDDYPKENRLLKKMKESPMVPIGFIGLTGIVIYGLYNFKNRGSTKPSIYLIHLRLAAQGTFLGSITLGLIYTIYKKQKHKFFNNEK